MGRGRFSAYDIFISSLSAITYAIDVLTDIWLIVHFFLIGQQVWAALTLGFVATAMLVMQVFSFHWHVTDKTLTLKTFLIHILFLAPLHRYISVLKLGLKSRRSDSTYDLDAAYRQLNDVSILRLFETFLESAPQLVLQLYIIFTDLGNFGPLIGVSTCCSLISASWAVTAYADALHLACKKLYKRSFVSMLTHLTWQTGMVMSRIFAIVLFAVAFRSFVLIPIAIHWGIMVVWITVLKPDFGSTPCERRLFTIVAAVVHVFCFLNLKDGPSRWRVGVYYGLTFVENALCVSLWFSLKEAPTPGWFDVLAFTVVFGGFLMGAVCMVLYYTCCHPSGPAPVPPEKPKFHQPALVNLNPAPQVTKPSIFDTSSKSARINLWLNASMDLSRAGLVDNPTVPTLVAKEPHNPGYHGDLPHTSPADAMPSKNCDQPSYGSYLDIARTGVPSGSQPHLNQTDDRPDHTGHSLVKSGQDQSLPDYNIVEMFSRCKLDPSFVSSSSLCEVYHNTSNPNISEVVKEASLRRFAVTASPTGVPSEGQYVDMSYNSKSGKRRKGRRSRLSDTMAESSQYGRQISVNNENSFYSPVSISPLDADKIWADSQSSFAISPSLRNFLFKSGSEMAINRNYSDNTGSISILPDTSRGLAHLSLSYSALDKNPAYSQHESSLRDNSCLSEAASSFVFKHGENNAKNLTNSLINKSGPVSFSNLSLQLPDSSNSRNQFEHVCNPDNAVLASDTKANLQTQKIYRHTPPNQNNSSRSVDSFYKEDSFSDKQSSYLSDRGLSLSDRRLSSNTSQQATSHPSLTSSGFQSEESNMNLSPVYMNHGLPATSQFQSTPIVENEIMSIPADLSTVEIKRKSLDEDIYINTNNSGGNLTPLTSKGCTSEFAPKNNIVRSMLSYQQYSTVKSDHTESPVLPPISGRRSSSLGSSGSGRFFKEPTLDDNDAGSQYNGASLSQSLASSSSRGPSRYLEKSSLSAYISGVSSTQSATQLSDDTMSLGWSDPELRSLKRAASARLMSKASSLPYLSDTSSTQQREKLDKTNSGPLYENINNVSQTNFYAAASDQPVVQLDVSAHRPRSDSPWKLKYLTAEPAQKVDVSERYMQLDEASVTRCKEADNDVHDSSISGDSPPLIESFDKSPHRLGRNVDLFNRHSWRASLDKEAKEQLLKDIKSLAPKNLYELKKKKTQVKKLSPVNVTEYTDSPYKFRRPSHDAVISDYTESPYKFRKSSENTGMEGGDSGRQSSESGEHIYPVTTGVYTDYVNVYKIDQAVPSNCPLARPESLSDSVFLNPSPVGDSEAPVSGEPSVDNDKYVRGEIHCESLGEDVVSRSLELSRTKSPINTSGINSAFKPVKPRRIEELAPARNKSNTTFIIPGETLENLSNKDYSNSSKTFDASAFSLDRSSYEREKHAKSKRRSSASRYSSGVDDSSVFLCSGSGVDSLLLSDKSDDRTPLNYLKLVGKTPLNFSAPSFMKGDGSRLTPQHSYSDSIPWEDGVNKSDTLPDSSCLAPRQPLKDLGNTPVISPIYGQDRRLSLEQSSRKRFMSTPKLSTGSELSATPHDSYNSGLYANVDNSGRRRSSGVGRTFGDNTSTWSAHGGYDSSAQEREDSVSVYI